MTETRWVFSLKQFTDIEKCNDFLEKIAKDCFVKDVSIIFDGEGVIYTVLYGEQLSR